MLEQISEQAIFSLIYLLFLVFKLNSRQTENVFLSGYIFSMHDPVIIPMLLIFPFMFIYMRKSGCLGSVSVTKFHF